MADASDELFFVDKAVTVGIHEIEKAVESVIEQALTFGREVGVLRDLRELALEQGGKLRSVEVPVELDVPDEQLRNVIESVTGAEAKDRLQVVETASGSTR